MAGTNQEAAQAFLNKKRKEKKEGKGGKKFDNDVLWFSLPKEVPCEVVIRFAPPTPGNALPGKSIATHWKVPLPGKGENKINSLKEFLGDKDPVERVLAKYRDVLNVEDYEASLKTYFNVFVKKVIVDGKEVIKDDNGVEYNPKVPRVLGVYGDYTLTWLIEKICDPDLGDVTDPFEGYWFKWSRETVGKWDRGIVPYSKKQMQDEFGTALGDSKEETEEILSKLHDMDKIWPKPSDDYIKKARKAAAAYEDMFSEKLKLEEAKENSLGANAGAGEEAESLDKPEPEIASSPDDVQDTVDTTAKEVEEDPKPEAVKEEAAAVNTPNGSPACFGNKDKLFAGFATEEEAEDAGLEGEKLSQLENCQICVYETDCAIKAGR
jgi:hypothetical protein